MEWFHSIIIVIAVNLFVFIQGQQLLGDDCKAKDINEDLLMKLRQLETNFLSYQTETQRELNMLKGRISDMEKQVNGNDSMYPFYLSFIFLSLYTFLSS